ncbi:hypothetical protein VFMJ11_A0695 [Aliivibrio fischeri MJ11]|uniref:Uncharacterized protein n=1 Tax=Aliivibrio fischeri (strain MJ11) TaxID=388396 RepID=B5EU76_ALIFM|nr:hypothetical protein [Aliivibrio fischeri]ACH64389.1 hypothetical protein VFMJ11_A0695 [Aliivibrio fischeri MJ11]
MSEEDIKIILSELSIRPYDLDIFNDEVIKCCDWLTKECGFRVNGRIQEYQKKIKQINKYRGVFSNEMYYILQSFNEMNQLLYIYKHLRKEKNKEFLLTLKKSIKGISFRNNPDKSHEDQARNHIFELLIASDFVNSGHKIDLSQRADIVITDIELLIECKRVSSLSALIERAKEAIEQINNDKTGFDGIIYIDITELFNELHEIYIIDEQGVFSAINGLSDSENIAHYMNEKIIKFMRQLVIDEREKFIKMVTENEKVHSINLVVNFIGLHLSMIHEDAVLGRAIYLIDQVDIKI